MCVCVTNSIQASRVCCGVLLVMELNEETGLLHILYWSQFEGEMARFSNL